MLDLLLAISQSGIDVSAAAELYAEDDCDGKLFGRSTMEVSKQISFVDRPGRKAMTAAKIDA
jgi:hypothetical protein